jgi:hypothetical protein
MNTPTSFIWITILFGKLFKYGDGTELCGYAGTNIEPLSRIL